MSDEFKIPSCGMHEALVSYMYEESSPEQAALFENHLRQCRECSSELDGFRRVRDMMQSWQLEGMPIIRITQPEPKKSILVLLKELLTATPLWAKGIAGLAAALLVLSVIGADIGIDRNGFHFSASLLKGRNPGTGPQGAVADNRMSRAEVENLVNKATAEGERRQADALKLELTRMESELKTTHTADLARVNARVQEQRLLIQTLERDIDRREGLSLADILLSEVGPDQGAQRKAPSNSGGDAEQ